MEKFVLNCDWESLFETVWKCNRESLFETVFENAIGKVFESDSKSFFESLFECLSGIVRFKVYLRIFLKEWLWKCLGNFVLRCVWRSSW